VWLFFFLFFFAVLLFVVFCFFLRFLDLCCVFRWAFAYIPWGSSLGSPFGGSTYINTAVVVVTLLLFGFTG